jgi:hypothetical protein
MDFKTNIMQTIESVKELTSHISFSVFGQIFFLSVQEDKKYGKRLYLQWFYHAPCSKTGEIKEWRGGKYYLSEHMTDDEIVKKAWAAAQAVVHHEVMEGFMFDNVILFNPHVDFRKILEISPHEVTRQQNFDT